MSECIHGLEIVVCDVCSPRAAPEGARPARAARVVPGSPRVPKLTATRPPAAPTGLRTKRVEHRIYLVVSRVRLAEVLGDLAEQDWRSEVGSAVDAFRWPDASVVERPSDLVVLVADLAGSLRLVAAANEPARRAVREVLDAAGVDVRVVLQPSWWVEA